MATLVVATTADAASVGPAAALLSMPGWKLGPSFHLEDSSPSSADDDRLVESFTNGTSVRLLKHERNIVEVDDLDLLWKRFTGEPVQEIIFLSRHAAATNRPALTIHPIGVPHLGEGEVPLHGGRAGWVGIPNTRMGPWIRLLRKVAEEQGLTPEFEITLEATHHGPVTHSATMFVEIGSTEEYWQRQDAAQAIALLVWRGLGLDGGGQGIGKWDGKNKGNKILFGIGGGHYVPRHMDIVMKDDVWVGHLLAGHSLPMDDRQNHQGEESDADCIRGRWKQALEVSLEATKLAFPGGHIIAHLDRKSFKGWQRNAITSFLAKRNINVGKSADFF